MLCENEVCRLILPRGASPAPLGVSGSQRPAPRLLLLCSHSSCSQAGQGIKAAPRKRRAGGQWQPTCRGGRGIGGGAAGMAITRLGGFLLFRRLSGCAACPPSCDAILSTSKRKDRRELVMEG